MDDVGDMLLLILSGRKSMQRLMFKQAQYISDLIILFVVWTDSDYADTDYTTNLI